MTLSGEKVLVTGGSGFIGQHIVRALLKVGAEVYVLDVASGNIPSGVTFLEGSIFDPHLLANAVGGVDHVVHAAAIAHLWQKDTKAFMQVNYEGTRAVLDAARDAHLKTFLHISTDVILKGWRDPGFVQDCNKPLPPLDLMAGPYSQSKWLADDLTRRERHIKTLRLYPTVPVGGGDSRYTPPTRMISDFLAGRLPAILESRLNFVDVTYVADMAVKALRAGEGGKGYIAAGENMMLSDFLKIVAEEADLPTLEKRVPWWIAYGFAGISEALASLSGNSPKASLEGVRLAREGLWVDRGHADDHFGLETRPVRPAIRQAVRWLRNQQS